MAQNEITLKWKRPESSEYPKVWHRFMARDLDSDKMVEYRIEDLTIEKAKEGFEHMKNNFMRDEPITEAMLKIHDEPNLYDDYVYALTPIVNQKMVLVCYRDGSDEIVGINWTFIETKDDKFGKQFYPHCKSPALKCFLDIALHLYRDFDLFEHFGVDKYMASFGLSVDRKYRGRGVGEQLLGARKIMCQEYGVKLTQTVFSSDFSSRNAENMGFKTDRMISYKDAQKLFPQYDLTFMKSAALSIKSLVY